MKYLKILCSSWCEILPIIFAEKWCSRISVSIWDMFHFIGISCQTKNSLKAPEILIFWPKIIHPTSKQALD